MAKWNEIAYLILDELKLKSDDSSFNVDHIVFLMLQYRTLLIKQRYVDQKRDIPIENQQIICVDLQTTNDCNSGISVKSTQKIPSFISLNGYQAIRIRPIGDPFNNLHYVLVSEERFSYVGNNKWLKNIIYFTKHSDSYLYLKSQNSNFKYLKKVIVTALFSNPLEAAKLSCDQDGNSCDYLNTEFPLENALIPILIEMIVKELTPSVYKPEDDVNDASDNLSTKR